MWGEVAIIIGVVGVLGVGVYRLLRRSSFAIDRGAVSERWIAEQRAESRDRFGG